MDFLSELNEAQRQAVLHKDGPSMVIAGAGSGKTRVLTYRIAHLLSQGVDAFQILSLTFTNKAAREMKERIGQLIGEGEAKNLWMGTFHSVFARILRSEAEKLGYPSNFTIYDTDDAKSLIKDIVKGLNLDDKTYKPGLVLNRISGAKSNLISARAYMENTTIQSDDAQASRPEIGEIYKRYESRCFQAGAMDFDDLLFKTNILLRDFPEVLHKYQTKFHYVLVDEFQDTNFSQYKILRALAAKFENICVVGDDAQSIYAFRGANIENMLNFKRDYPDAEVFKLEQNYRSTQNIVNAANTIIAKNTQQIKKEVWTSNTQGNKIKVLKSLTDNEEGNQIAREIFTIKHREQVGNSHMAILYRTNAQSRAIEEALRRKSISYKIYGGLSFYQRKEVKDLLAYFRLVVNPKDEEALKRVINYPARGIGKTSVEKVMVAASEQNTSMWDVLNQLGTTPVGLNSGAVTKASQFVTMIKSFQTQLHEASAYDLGSKIASSSGILKELHADRSTEGMARYENVVELVNSMKKPIAATPGAEDAPEFQGLTQFLQEVALYTTTDDNDNGDNVSLMTIHSAKGLEFPHVFIAGLEEALFPSQLSLHSRSDLEEERRLFYVALTRAKDTVTLSHASSRFKWGNLVQCEPSRFIEEIDPKFLESVAEPSFSSAPTRKASDFKSKPASRPSPQPKRALKPVQQATTNAPISNPSGSVLQQGMSVEHDRFGRGKILQIEGSFPDQKATVFFQGIGQKQLLLRFAKLTPVD